MEGEEFNLHWEDDVKVFNLHIILQVCFSYVEHYLS